MVPHERHFVDRDVIFGQFKSFFGDSDAFRAQVSVAAWKLLGAEKYNQVTKNVLTNQPGGVIPSSGVMDTESRSWTELNAALFPAEKANGKIRDQGVGGSASKSATAEGDNGDESESSHDEKSTEEVIW